MVRLAMARLERDGYAVGSEGIITPFPSFNLLHEWNADVIAFRLFADEFHTALARRPIMVARTSTKKQPRLDMPDRVAVAAVKGRAFGYNLAALSIGKTGPSTLTKHFSFLSSQR